MGKQFPDRGSTDEYVPQKRARKTSARPSEGLAESVLILQIRVNFRRNNKYLDVALEVEHVEVD